MKDFRQQHGGGGRRDFDNRGGFEKKHHSGRNEQMHQAVCSECGRTCEVPFVPNGNKPVFCNDCFAQKRGGQAKPFERQEFSRPNNTQHERPQQQNAPAPRDHRVDELKSQMDAMNSKLDRLVKMMELNLATMTAPKHFEQKTNEQPSKLEKVLKTMPTPVKEVKVEAKKVVAAKKPVAKTATKAPAKAVSKAKPVAPTN